jgi:hypothetical protein
VVSGVSFVGDVLGRLLRSAAGVGFADAGVLLREGVVVVGDVTVMVLIVFRVLLVLVLWFVPCLLWVRRGVIVCRLADARGGADLLALRVFTGSPAVLVELPVSSGGFAVAWWRGDQGVIATLCVVVLAQVGLRL